ncbi:hypothetical protein C8Q76DRAFT_797896 [Earliella scabrosa]|nr:hypothetical protein C8Q76DRAFT_797896 [Earliella scabrosa]
MASFEALRTPGHGPETGRQTTTTITNLPAEITELMMTELNLVDLLAWRATCRSSYQRTVLSLRGFLRRALRPITDEPDQLLKMLYDHRAVIGGEVALYFILRDSTYEYNTLWIYAPFDWYPLLIDALRTALRHSITRETTFNKARFGAYDWTESTQFNLKSGIIVTTFQSPTFSAMTSLCRQPCTLLINYVTTYSFGCAYPHLTLNRQGLLADWALPCASIIKYAVLNSLTDQGFHISWIPHPFSVPLPNLIPESDASSIVTMSDAEDYCDMYDGVAPPDVHEMSTPPSSTGSELTTSPRPIPVTSTPAFVTEGTFLDDLEHDALPRIDDPASIQRPKPVDTYRLNLPLPAIPIKDTPTPPRFLPRRSTTPLGPSPASSLPYTSDTADQNMLDTVIALTSPSDARSHSTTTSATTHTAPQLNHSSSNSPVNSPCPTDTKPPLLLPSTHVSHLDEPSPLTLTPPMLDQRVISQSPPPPTTHIQPPTSADSVCQPSHPCLDPVAASTSQSPSHLGRSQFDDQSQLHPEPSSNYDSSSLHSELQQTDSAEDNASISHDDDNSEHSTTESEDTEQSTDSTDYPATPSQPYRLAWGPPPPWERRMCHFSRPSRECFVLENICPNELRYFGDPVSLIDFIDPLGDDRTRIEEACMPPLGTVVMWKLFSSYKCTANPMCGQIRPMHACVRGDNLVLPALPGQNVFDRSQPRKHPPMLMHPWEY